MIKYWQRTESEVRALWDPSGVLEYSLAYSGEPIEWRTSPSGEASIPYAGLGTVELRLKSSSGSIEVFYCSVAGSAPARPTSIGYKGLTEQSLVLSWGVPSDLSGTANWMVVGVVNGVETLLSMLPVSSSSDILLLPGGTDRLSKIRVYGVGFHAVRSEASPDLSFNGMSGGPTIVLGDFSVSSTSVSISWQVASYDVLTNIKYCLIGAGSEVIESGDALPVETKKFAVVNYIGPLTLTVDAWDQSGRFSAEHKTTYVYNHPPLPPSIVIEEVGLEFIRVRVVPNASSESPTESIVLTGANQQVVLSAPYVKEFTQLRQGTAYQFTAVAINPTGLRSSLSEAVSATTIKLPLADSNSITSNYFGGPILPYLHSLLSYEVRHYVLQLYTDTRIRNAYEKQIVEPPAGFNATMEFMMKVGKEFGAAIRSETQDEESYRASLTIDKTNDVLEKLAIWVERIEYGSVWNAG